MSIDSCLIFNQVSERHHWPILILFLYIVVFKNELYVHDVRLRQYAFVFNKTFVNKYMFFINIHKAKHILHHRSALLWSCCSWLFIHAKTSVVPVWCRISHADYWSFKLVHMPYSCLYLRNVTYVFRDKDGQQVRRYCGLLLSSSVMTQPCLHGVNDEARHQSIQWRKFFGTLKLIARRCSCDESQFLPTQVTPILKW